MNHSDRLPRPTVEHVWRVGQAERVRWNASRPTHVFGVDRVKIGTINGVVQWTETSNHKALCGVYVMATVGCEKIAPGDVACDVCRRKYTAKALGNKRLPQAAIEYLERFDEGKA